MSILQTMVNKMVNFSLSEILRGILVSFISSIIIGFMVIILGPLVPFIPFDGIFPLIILFIIFVLTFITYFLLPSELEEDEEITTTNKMINLE